MQISSPTLALVTPLPGAPTAVETRGKSAQGTPGNAVELTSPQSTGATAPTPESDAADSVSVSAQARAQEASNAPAPVYAEIWKGAIKVAQVDIHGHVISLTGLVSSGGGGSIAGPLLAAQRAVQVAQQVGGEIRSAGQPVDGQTLLMRARLAKAYTA
jgi:hypothetical protein